MTDRGLLDRYIDSGSDAAFAELARRHTRMVYATCWRDLGDAGLAEDATQAVFILLARKGAGLRRGVSIGGWLFKAARLISRNAARREAVRRKHEVEAIPNMDAVAESERAWPSISPWLNDAISSLPDADREAILLRYFDGLSVRETALELGIHEDAAGKRIARAVERMRGFLRGKEVPVSSVVLAAALAGFATFAAPARVEAAVALAPRLPLPEIAHVEHSLNPLPVREVSTMSASKLTVGVFCGVAFLIAVTTAVVLHARNTRQAGAQTAAMEPVLLRFKPRVGVYTLRMTQGQTGTATVGGNAVPVNQVETITVTRTIDKVLPDGSAAGTMAVNDVALTINGRPVTLPATAVASYEKPQPITISPKYEIKVTSGAPTEPGSGWSSSPLGLFESMQQSESLPEQPVTPGATWQATEDFPALGMHMTVPCVLAGFEMRKGHKIARINETISATLNGSAGGGVPMSGTMTGQGIELFDTDSGQQLDQNMTFHLDATINVASPGAAPQPGHVKMDVAMDMAAQPPAGS